MAPQREWLERDYYAVLGVSESTSRDEIKKAYRKLARELHPDSNKSADAEARFKEVNEAYSVLGDPETRKEYDEVRRLAASGGMGGLGGFAGPGGASFTYGGDADFGDLLRTIFEQGGAGGGRGSSYGYGSSRRPRRGTDLRADVHLSFDEALSGVRTKLKVTGDGACDNCGGSGARPGTAPHVCGTCGGSGTVAVNQGPFSLSEPCPTCSGRGRVIEDPCPVCDGTGRVVKPRELTVKIPAGIKDGGTVRVAGRGGPGAGGGPAGDVLVTVHVEPHPIFGRRGDDVTIELPVTYSEAALGSNLTIPDPEGGTTTIKLPAGTASGRTFRIRGKGAPISRNGRRGDLLVTVKVEVPSRLNRQQRKLLEQLQEHDDIPITRAQRLGLD
ncbi:MAG TPA: molecular chaperone DnaJ [Nitriliruptorales bacterium]